MITHEEIKQIVMIGYLRDDMIDKILPITSYLRFEEGESVFREGDIADRFFMLKRGKILLEKNIAENISAFVGSIKPGYSFGWSAMLDGGYYTSHAVCAEASEVFCLRRRQIKQLIESDHDLGYIFSQRLLRVMKNRLDQRTDQLLRIIKNHPDLQNLFEN